MEKGVLEALSPRKRGPKAKRPDPSARRIAELERENQKLEKKLRQAETIIDVQKKFSRSCRYPSQRTERRTHEHSRIISKRRWCQEFLRCFGCSKSKLLPMV